MLKGRCKLVSLSNEQKTRVVGLLSDFGHDKSNIPEYGTGNCQNWVAGAAYMLERAGVVDFGEGAFWESMIARSAEGMGDESLWTGRKWIRSRIYV